MTTLGIIGAGNIGSQVARVAVANGYDVVIANSRGPETLADLVAELAQLAGKIVLDTNNYYFERDGHIEALDKGETTTSELVQAQLPDSKIAKAFNHIYAAEITTDGTPAGTPNRRALAPAGDDAEAVAFVTRFYDEAGFDTVNVGPLSESWRVERDRPAYVIRQNAEELAANVARANRLP